MMFEDQIRRNRRRSYLLLLLVPALLVLLIYVLGAAVAPTVDPFLVLAIGILLSTLYVAASYYRSDEMVLAVTGAEPADPERHRRLHDLVEGLSIATGSPAPRLYVQESPDINAFATGRNPEDGKVCVTTGALERLTRDELEGVLAHELAHVQNYDVLFTTLVVALVGAVAIASEIFLRGLWFRGRSSGGRGNPVILLLGVALAVLAPVAARLVQLAISRKREYLADATGARTTRYPDGLADALEKIRSNEGMEVNRAVVPLYLSDPLRGRPRALLSTHPPIEERIRRLREM